MYTLLHLKWITKDLRYSIGNSAQGYVAAWMGEDLGGERIHVYVWLSHLAIHLKLSQHWLLIGCTPIQNKKSTTKSDSLVSITWNHPWQNSLPEAWHAAAHGVAKSQTCLSNWTAAVTNGTRHRGDGQGWLTLSGNILVGTLTHTLPPGFQESSFQRAHNSLSCSTCFASYFTFYPK